MDFLQDYFTYHKCYSIPRNYVLWSAIGLIGAVVHRKAYFMVGDKEVYCANFILLVGPQGNKKSTPCDFAKGWFMKACPQLALGASNQTVEDIVKYMSSEDFVRSYTNEMGESTEARPIAFFVNEFKNWISYNPVRMLNFLGDIYDRKFYDSRTIKRGSEIIINPSLNILACENPEQLVSMMRKDIITGGMARRVVMINEVDYSDPIPIPFITTEAREAETRIIDRLKDIQKTVGKFKFSPDGEAFFVQWYMKNHERIKSTVNTVMRGYLSTKDIHMQKVAMCLDITSDKPMFLFTVDLLETAAAFLDCIEEHMPKLSVAAGRNDLMGPQQALLDALRTDEGMLPEKQVYLRMESEMTRLETWAVLDHLEKTDQILKKKLIFEKKDKTKVEKLMIILPEKYEELKKSGIL